MTTRRATAPVPRDAASGRPRHRGTRPGRARTRLPDTRAAATAATALLAIALLGAAGCAAGPSTASSGPGEVRGTVTVLAAASLTGVLEDAAESFEARHPGVDVVLGFGGSSALAQQVLAGAPADVFAAASPETMALVTDAGLAAGEPAVFARNVMEIAVPRGNPGDVDALEDLGDPRRRIALCAAQVPCGASAARLLAAAAVDPAPDTLERDVRAALVKVRLGEVDAALVYRTDVLAAGPDVEGIAVLGADAAANEYEIAALADAPNPAAAQAFAAFVLSAPAQDVLAAAGFGAPPPPAQGSP